MYAAFYGGEQVHKKRQIDVITSIVITLCEKTKINVYNTK